MTNRRERLPVPPASVIRALPSIGKLMITAKHGGATHERIGVIESVSDDEDWLVCSGAEHDSRINPSAIVSIVIDRTSIMQNQVYPRIDFLGSGGEVLFSVVGFSGIEPFDAALAQFGEGEALPEQDRDASGERAEVTLEDLGAEPFAAALAAGQLVTISFERIGFRQRWTGTVEAVKPAMGFINVMRPDFHLHLKGGSVEGWARDVTDDVAVLRALGENGAPSGLAITGPVAAFSTGAVAP